MVTISHTLSLFSLIPIISASPYRLDSPYAQGFRWLQSHRHRAATPVLPTGWSYTNCYSDPSSSRVLSTKISSSSSNTQDTCVAQCNTQGYTYAGVEYGVECWCGNILNNPQVTTSCNMACPGDSTQKCGDGNKIGLFTKSSTASAGWTSLGCFVDQDDRTLKGGYYTDNAMTPALCQSKCSTAGYSMAGVEYGTECYCGNSLSKNVGSSSCTSTCGGDSSQICGGSWALNVYQKTASTTTTTTSTTSTTSSTSTASTTSTTSSSTTSSSASASPTWTSVGCIADQSARTLNGQSYSDATSMTPAFCQAKCAAAGYSYAGVEYSKQCYCGNTLTNGGTSSTGCTYACAGDSSLICGGNYALNVFKLAGGSTSSSSSSSSSTTSSSSTSSIATTSTTSTSPTSSAVYGWSSVGCIVDQSARTLNAQSYSDSSMTPALCQSKCYAAGYTFAGTEYSSQCYCGNTLTNGGTSSSGCTSTCAGNSGLICGGSWALSVYKYTPSPASSSIASTISSTSSSISTSSAISSTISSTSSSSSTTSTTSTTSASPSPTYTSLGCYRDSYNRVLSQGQGADTSTRTIQSCFAQCASLGYCYAGLETGSECWCNDSLLTSSDSGSKLSMDQCQMTCTGNSSQYCGGSWSLEIYYDGTKSKCKGPPTTSVVSSSSTTSTTTSTTATSTQSTSTNGLWYQTNGSNTGKVIIAHVIVGNTYSYTTQQWINEIKMASAQGIDAFALDFGYDSWQAGQMDSAYDAASSSGTGFKMLLSLDFTVLGCSDNSIITTNINKYKNHAAQLKDSSGNMWVQTFDGGSCRSDSQWNSVLRNNGIGIKFVPAFFNDETNTKMKDMFPSINGDFLWGGAWPKGNNVLDWSEDDYRISRSGLSRPPDVYMTTVSPLFFVHYSGRNSIWRSDDHLYARRWEDLFSHRALVDAVQIVTWNDYGESTYIGPIGKDMPSGTNWVTGFDHTPFLQMTGYYAWAFKTGQYPTITSDKIFFWGRPHSKGASASNDGLGKPTNWDWTSDSLWIVLFSTGSGSLSVTMGSSSSTFGVSAGVNKFTLGLAQASSVTAKLTRNGVQVFSVQGAVTYTGSPSQYNWNYAAAAGP